MNRGKKTILVFSKYYLPAYKAGGPIRSVSNLVDWCGDAYNFKIITGDRDCQENKPFKNIKFNKWKRVGNAQVFYVRKENVRFYYFLKLLRQTDYDLVYFNSFFEFQFSIQPLILLKFFLKFELSNVLLAPRGEFSAGAIQIKSFKKKSFIKIAKLLGIYNKINWQATDRTEYSNIRNIIGTLDSKIYLAPNLPQKTPEKIPEYKHVNNGLCIVYLSRVTPKKNLLFALKALKKIKNINVEFDIYGLKDNQSYWRNCKNIIDTLGANIRVNYKGTIPHDDVVPTLATYDLFFLPTKGENYGHAIYESLLAGTPVLISDQTPWRELEDKGLGWDISLNNQMKYIETIKNLNNLSTSTMKKKKKQVRESIRALDIHKNVEINKEMFNNLLS